MNNFKVGDQVRVKNDLVVGRMYGNDLFTSKMKPFLGKVVTIATSDSSGGYTITEVNRYYFTDEMLEPVNKYPRVMWVSDDGETWLQRVVFMEKCGKYLAWKDAESLEEAEGVYRMTDWKYAKTFEKLTKEMTLEEVCKKLGYNIKIIK